ncbi:MAG: histidine kinase [Cellulophaga sp.]
MKKLFIHHPLFRLLSPIFNGVIAYLLILLLNNNVTQLQEQFLGEEIYVCIGISYIIQEFSRGLLLLFKKYTLKKLSVLTLSFQIIIALILGVILVTLSFTAYYKYVSGYTPNFSELYLFNSIFSCITLIYILLTISHHYLYKINTEKLLAEKLLKQNITEDFMQFKKEINPKLLFESLEYLIVLMHQDKEKTDEFIDHLSLIYRYILNSKSNQLISVKEELSVVKELVFLLNHLPYSILNLENRIATDFLVVPGSLLHILEQIIRRTIVTSNTSINLAITEKSDFFELAYKTNDKITNALAPEHLAEIKRVYSIYSTTNLSLVENNAHRIIRIPKLQTS